MYEYNDGGRSEAGFKGRAGDCVARSIAIATGLPYREVYDRLADSNANQRVTKRTKKSTAGKRTARNGIYTKRKWFKDYMVSLGWRWVPCQKVGDPKRVKFTAEELPGGAIIVAVRNHYAAMIDGVVNDTYQSCGSHVTVYGYWQKREDNDDAIQS